MDQQLCYRLMATACFLPVKFSDHSASTNLMRASMEAKEGSSTTHRMSSTSCVTASAFHPTKPPTQHCESVQMVTRHRRRQQDPALSNVHSKLQGEGEVIAQNRSRLDDATAASPNVQSNNNSGRSMNSKLLFMPSASCQPPTLPPLPDSPATGLACSSSAFSYSSSVVPPKPDSSGAAIGIPIPPPQPRNSTQASATTLPPLRSVPAKGSNNSKTSGPQYRKVFVPTTVVHNGVARQMLVPMICMVAPMRRASGVPMNAAGLDTANRGGGKSLPTLASKRTSASGNEPALLTRRKVGHRQQAPDKGGSPLSTHHAAGAHKKKSHGHHHTRSSTRVAKRAPAISPKAEDQCSDTAALTMLADAALMDL